MSPGLKKYIMSFLKDKGISSNNIHFHTLRGHGSNRVFIRIIPYETGPCFIAMCNFPTNDVSKRENIAYVMIGNHLFRKGIPVPEIYRFDLEHGWFIMEDMGNISLQEQVKSGENDNKIPGNLTNFVYII